jgi:hypothetical protein
MIKLAIAHWKVFVSLSKSTIFENLWEKRQTQRVVKIDLVRRVLTYPKIVTMPSFYHNFDTFDHSWIDSAENALTSQPEVPEVV